MDKIVLNMPDFSLEERLEKFSRLIADRYGLVRSYRLAYDYDKGTDDEVESLAYNLIAENDYVKDRITRLHDDKKVLQSITRDDLLVAMKRVVDVSISDYFTMNALGGLQLKNFRDWTPSMKMACCGMKQSKFGVEVKILDKMGAINTISNIMGYSEQSNTMIKVTTEYGNMSDKQLKSIIEDAECTAFIEESVSKED